VLLDDCELQTKKKVDFKLPVFLVSRPVLLILRMVFPKKYFKLNHSGKLNLPSFSTNGLRF
jgi:hypothetical protein